MSGKKKTSRLMSIFENIDPEELKLIGGLISETEFLEERMAKLKTLPFISVHPRNPHLQKQTAAAKQYKECSQSYANNIRILLNVIRKEAPSEQDELLRRLEEFR